MSLSERASPSGVGCGRPQGPLPPPHAHAGGVHVHGHQHHRAHEVNPSCYVTPPVTSLGDGNVRLHPHLAGCRRACGPPMTEMSLRGAWLDILFTNNISEVCKENQQVIFFFKINLSERQLALNSTGLN